MVKCNCGKEISSVPDWLRDVKVNFVCHNCPNRDLPGITQVDLMGTKPEEVVFDSIKSTETDELEDEDLEEED